MSEQEYQETLRRLNMTEEEADKMTEKVLAEIKKKYGWRKLVGTTEEVPIPEEWKEHIWYCPSCTHWFPIDWNHDDEVCCACAGCTKHPFLNCMVDCNCKRCKGKNGTRYN